MAVQEAEHEPPIVLPPLGRLPLSDEVAPPWLDDDEPPEPGPLPPDPLGPDPLADHGRPAWLADEGPGGWDVEPGPPEMPSEWLAQMAPGLELATELEGIDPAGADEYQLVEMIAGYHRMAAWAQSHMTHLVGRLSRRPALNPQSPMPADSSTLNVTAEEIAPRLGISRFAARRMVDAARAFRLKLEDTAVALHQGRIDYPKACVILRLLGDQPDDVAWEVQQLVLPNASHQTITQLERAITKAIIAIDPHRATARHRKARDSRRVGHPRPLPDGMASLYAILPATDAAGLDLALEAAARAAKAAGDTRTIDQLRADALALLGHGALERGFIGVPDPVATEQSAESVADDSPVAEPGGTPPAEPGSTAVAEPDDSPAAEPGGAPPADPGNAAVAELDDSPAAEPEGTGAAEPVGTAAAEPGSTATVEPETGGGTVTEPGIADVPDEESSADQAPVFQTGNGFLRTPHMPIGAIGGRCAQVHVTIPLSVLIPPELLRHPDGPGGQVPGDSCAHGGPEPHSPPGAVDPTGQEDRDCCSKRGLAEDIDDEGLPQDWYPGPTPAEVAELDGYGPITPDVARALAYSSETWRRLITDPLSGELLDVGRTRYRPPAAMADFVRLRDRTCVSPTCSTPARNCQLDHVVPWQFGGVTSAENLGPGCARDHQVKTSGAFQLEHLGAGTFVWTTPSGHRYRRDHTGRISLIRRSAQDFRDEPPF